MLEQLRLLGRRPVTFDVTRARQMRAAGLSYAAVARELGVATGTVHAALSAAQ
jgi:transposase